MANSILPPNAVALEKGLVGAGSLTLQIPVPLKVDFYPTTTPMTILPWLAWEMSVFRWVSWWTDDRRRSATLNAISDHRRRGSRASMDELLSDYDASLTLIEWWEEGGSGDPFTFTVNLPVNDADPSHVTASFATSLLTDIASTKPARARCELRQTATAQGYFPINVAARTFTMVRSLSPLADPDPADLLALQTEDGEPLLGGEGLVLEDH